VVNPDQLLDSRRVQLVTLATHYRLPTIYPFRENVEIGGLMSYGSSAAERDRQVGIYAGRILKGEKPAVLPVIRAAKFEFVRGSTACWAVRSMRPGARAAGEGNSTFCARQLCPTWSASGWVTSTPKTSRTVFVSTISTCV
jgi:hypothetical protein